MIADYIHELVNNTSICDSGYDTLSFGQTKFRNYDLGYDTAGNLIRVLIADSNLESFNFTHSIYDIHRMQLNDNYMALTNILAQSEIPLINTSTIYLNINEAGEVYSSYYRLSPGLDSAIFIDQSIFASLHYPILNLNGQIRPYKLAIGSNLIKNAINLRFLSALKDSVDITPVFLKEDSLYLFHSEADLSYLMYSNAARYKDKGYLYNVSDEFNLSGFFYDFNKDGHVDFVAPKTSPIGYDYAVIYGGKKTPGSPGFSEYHKMKYPPDSLYFSCNYSGWSSRTITLFMFTEYGDSVLLECDYRKLYKSILETEYGKELAQYAIPDKKDPYMLFYMFTDNLDKTLENNTYYITDLSEAKREFKKMTKRIYYLRDHPEEIPK